MHYFETVNSVVGYFSCALCTSICTFTT